MTSTTWRASSPPQLSVNVSASHMGLFVPITTHQHRQDPRAEPEAKRMLLTKGEKERRGRRGKGEEGERKEGGRERREGRGREEGKEEGEGRMEEGGREGERKGRKQKGGRGRRRGWEGKRERGRRQKGGRREEGEMTHHRQGQKGPIIARDVRQGQRTEGQVGLPSSLSPKCAC